MGGLVRDAESHWRMIPSHLLPFTPDHYFPLQPESKRPYPGASWKHIQTNPVTSDEKTQWKDYPDCNWALVCGAPIGDKYLAVADPDGPIQLAWARENLPPTMTVSTGRPEGGEHWYYLTDAPIPTQHIGPGVLVKGVGGYVVAPGSTHESGKLYAVLNPEPPVRLGGEKMLELLKRSSASSGKRRLYRKSTTGSTRSEIEQAVICRLLRKGCSSRTIFYHFADPKNKREKFLEMSSADPENARRWLNLSIRTARRELDNHDRTRGRFLSGLAEIRTELLAHPRLAVAYLWEKLLAYARRFGRVSDDNRHISFTASKRQLGDTAYRAFTALTERLVSLGAQLQRISSGPHPRGRIASTYVISVKNPPLDVTYGERADEGAGAIAEAPCPSSFPGFHVWTLGCFPRGERAQDAPGAGCESTGVLLPVSIAFT